MSEKLYIVWSKVEFIYDIYKDINTAISKERLDEDNIIWGSMKDLEEYSLINADDTPNIIALDYDPKHKNLYVCIIRYSKIGREYNYCNIGFTKNEMIDFALLHFDVEHARPELENENCPDCPNNRGYGVCRNKFVDELQSGRGSEIEYLCGYESIDVVIQKFKIK